MAEKEIYKLQISVEVDKEQGQARLQELTKQLEQQGFRIKEVNKEIAQSTKELTKQQGFFHNILQSGISIIKSYILGIASVGLAIREIYKETTEYIKVNRELSGVLKAINSDTSENRKLINDYIQSLTKGTYFTKDETIRAFTELVKITGDVNSALKLLQISMDTSVFFGKSLTETINTIRLALMSGRDASIILGKEFGTLATQGKDVNEILTNLGKTVENARLNITQTEKGYTQFIETLKNLAQTIGNLVLPVLNYLFKSVNEAINDVINTFQSLFKIVSILFDKLTTIIKKNVSLTLQDIKKEINNASEEIKNIFNKQTETEIKNLDKIKNAYIQSRKERMKQQEDEIKEREKATEELKKIEEKIFENTLKYTNDAFQYKIKMLEKEKEETLKTLDKALLDEKTKQEKRKQILEYYELMITQITEEQEKKRKEIRDEIQKLNIDSIKDNLKKQYEMTIYNYNKDLEKYKELKEKKQITDEEYNEYIIVRTKQFNKELEDINNKFVQHFGDKAEAMKKVFDDLSSEMTSVFSNFISNAIKGGKNLEDAMKNVFNNILNAFVNMLIRMVAEYLARKFVFSVLGITPIGGVYSAMAGAVMGGFQTGTEEVPKTGMYLLHKGEKVISSQGIGSEHFTENKKTEIHLHINTFDIRQIDRLHIERIARQLKPFLR